MAESLNFKTVTVRLMVRENIIYIIFKYLQKYVFNKKWYIMYVLIKRDLIISENSIRNVEIT